jgi:L-threonylcarbamoyladenylate synthase
MAQALIRAAGLPIAATVGQSQRRRQPDPARARRRIAGRRVSLILDGGPCAVGVESTVLDLTARAPTLLRPAAPRARRSRR